MKLSVLGLAGACVAVVLLGLWTSNHYETWKCDMTADAADADVRTDRRECWNSYVDNEILPWTCITFEWIFIWVQWCPFWRQMLGSMKMQSSSVCKHSCTLKIPLLEITAKQNFRGLMYSCHMIFQTNFSICCVRTLVTPQIAWWRLWIFIEVQVKFNRLLTFKRSLKGFFLIL